VIASVLGVSTARASAIAAEYPLAAYPAPVLALSTLVSDARACARRGRTSLQNGDPSAAAVPWPSFNTSSDVLSLALPQPQIETDFASSHHCAFWAAG
jgi:hypothetical protein